MVSSASSRFPLAQSTPDSNASRKSRPLPSTTIRTPPFFSPRKRFRHQPCLAPVGTLPATTSQSPFRRLRRQKRAHRTQSEVLHFGSSVKKSLRFPGPSTKDHPVRDGERIAISRIGNPSLRAARRQSLPTLETTETAGTPHWQSCRATLCPLPPAEMIRLASVNFVSRTGLGVQHQTRAGIFRRW